MSTGTSGQPYKRILLKLSGEVLAGSQKSGFDFQVIKSLVAQVAEIVELGTERSFSSSVAVIFSAARPLPRKAWIV